MIGLFAGYLGYRAVDDAPVSNAAPPAPVVAQLRIIGVKDYDPEGDGHESSSQVVLAWDNNVATVWSTELYQDRDVGGLKSGVGLVIDLGAPKKIARLEVLTPSTDTDWSAQVYASDEVPPRSPGGVPRASPARGWAPTPNWCCNHRCAQRAALDHQPATEPPVPIARGRGPRLWLRLIRSGRDDTTLAKLAAVGDRDALDVLLDRHVDRVHAICRRILGNPEDALDASQEALIAIARAIARFDGRSAFTTWLYRVATNAALDELRRRDRRPRPSVILEEAATTAGSGPEASGDRIDIDAALARIPEEFRVAVVLRDLCDLDYAQIAEVLDVPPGTVRSRISRGRAALAVELGPTHDAAPPNPGNQARPARRPTEHQP